MRKRPGWVWTISILMAFSGAWTMFSFWLIFSGAISLNPAQEAYFSSLTPIDFAITLLTAALNLTGASLLFLLRASAPYAFTAGFLLGLVSGLYQYLAKPLADVMTTSSNIGTALGTALSLVIIFYSFRLKKRGVLK
jgi:hypothetical protein